MSGCLNGLPQELYTNQLIPWLVSFDGRGINYSCRSLSAFACSHTLAHRSVRLVLGGSQEVIDFQWETKQVPFDEKDKTIKNYVLQRLTVHVLKSHPELRDTLLNVRGSLISAGKDPNKITITSLLNHARKVQNRDLIAALVPFDLSFKQIDVERDSLREVLIDLLSKGQIDLAQLILAHPKSVSIGNLGEVLNAAILTKNISLVQEIFSLLRAKDIGITCLQKALCKAVEVNSLEAVKLVFSHPNASQISGLWLARALLVTTWQFCKVDNPQIVLEIVSHPNAKELPLDYEIPFGTRLGLKISLKFLVEDKKAALVAAALHHPRSIELSSEDLHNAGKALVTEEDTSIPLQLRQMLEKDELEHVFDTFMSLSANIRHFLFLMLCKEHGSPSNNIDDDGLVHFKSNPLLLRPILQTLTTP